MTGSKRLIHYNNNWTVLVTRMEDIKIPFRHSDPTDFNFFSTILAEKSFYIIICGTTALYIIL
jgi:hypothetical protein